MIAIAPRSMRAESASRVSTCASGKAVAAALCCALSLAVSAEAAPRGERLPSAAKSAAAQMVTGPDEPIQEAAAAGGGMIFRLTPRKDYPGGSYNTSGYTQANISGQTVTLSTLPTRVYIELQLSDWGSSETGNGYMRLWEAYVDALSYSSGSGSALIPAIEPCASNVDCEDAFGSDGPAGFCNQSCTFAWINKTRADGIQITAPCSTNIWECGNYTNPNGHNCFGVLDSEVSGDHCGLADSGGIKYAASFALDARLGAFGTYTVEFRPQDVYAADDTAPDSVSITVAALTPAVINIPLNMPCMEPADCFDGNECTDDVCDLGTCFNPPSIEGSPCGVLAGPCDLPDTCTGNGFCDPKFKNHQEVCRAAAGGCDAEEFCSGNSSVCPPDEFLPLDAVCRAVAGGCDIQEVCSGSSPLCPADVVKVGGTVCRAADGACDLQETCNGSSPLCPADAIRPNGVLCRFSQGPCDLQEACNGLTKACPPNLFRDTTFVCRLSAHACDLAETCDGASAQCPANEAQADGTACPGDGSACTDDWCMAGICQSFEDCACPAAEPACGDGCCAVGDEGSGACAADCDDLQGAADFFHCFRSTAYSPGNPCLVFDSDGDSKVTLLDYRLYLLRQFGGP